MMSLALGLALATLVSEDLACAVAGLLVARGDIGATPAVVACGAGIWLGDIGLWAMGRIGRDAALQWRWIAGRTPPRRLRDIARFVERRAGLAIAGSRFVPGTRLPAYVIAGAAGVSIARFAAWSAVAVAVWTPALVLGSVQLGASLASRSQVLASWSAPAGAAAALGALTLVRLLGSAQARTRVRARLARWCRWEFWPMWLFYAPVAAWVGWLSLRHGGLPTITAANPGMPDGGTLGESKADILAALPARWTIPHVLIGTGPSAERVRAAREAIEANGWHYPVIMKPDVGQRGVGVRLVPDEQAMCEYLAGVARPVLVQPYHPGPFEAGVFYYRFPGWRSGRILSITDKELPEVVGNGSATLAELVWAHPRYRMQASMFLARHRARADSVVAVGERVRLSIAGNHAQGAVFRDGAHLGTEALERRIDEIAWSYPGFFVGRFDIRYGDVDRFKAGEDIAIVELNGATAESTNVYDPSATLFGAYRVLFRQWSIVFAIGAENRRRGAAASSLGRLARLLRAHCAASPVGADTD
jgi:membrane protein DedA with SNARE-associated domain